MWLTSVGVEMTETRVVANYEFKHGNWKVRWTAGRLTADLVSMRRAGQLSVDWDDVRPLIEALERFSSEVGLLGEAPDVGET